jgi:hypothetical protein
MFPWRAVLLGATSAVVGCSFLVSTDGLSGTVVILGGGDGGGTDATATSEAGISDASADTASDGADAAPPPPFCASLMPQPVLCADFDNGLLTDYGDIQGAPPTLDTTLWTSPARSMLSVVEAPAANRSSKVTHAYLTTATSLQVSFSIYVDEYDEAHDVELVAVQLRPSGTEECIVTASVRTSAWTLDESCYASSSSVLSMIHRSSVLVKKGRWTRVSFSADFGARTLAMTVDDQKAFVGLAMQPLLSNGPSVFAMGIGYLQTASTRAKVRFDDVIYDFQ